MTPKPKQKHGGAGRNQGRKPGPSGKLDKRLNIKVTAYEVESYTDTAIEAGLSRSEWVRKTLNKAAK